MYKIKRIQLVHSAKWIRARIGLPMPILPDRILRIQKRGGGMENA